MAFRWCLSTALAARHPTIIALPAIPRSERRKILIDLPGFGYSDKPRVFSYNIHSRL
jgi:pimeloyl-ACP methyl ester carboxylesterase